MDEIAEKQRQRERELEEKERLRREALLGRSTEGLSRPSELPAGSHPSEPGAAAAPTTGKYVPRFKRERAVGSGQAPPSESDHWGSGSQAPPSQSDRWGSGSRAPPQDPERVGSGASRPLPHDSDRMGGSRAPQEPDKWGGNSSKTEPWRPSRARNPPRG